MKINGQELGGPRKETFVIPYKEGQEIPFTVQAVIDYSEFDRLCPEPQPPKIRKRGGEVIEDTTDEDYKKKRDELGQKRVHYMVLKSLEPTNIEWDRVKMNDPDTWHLWEEELGEAGFTPPEKNYILQKVMDICGLNQERIDEATKNFLAGRQEEASS